MSSWLAVERKKRLQEACLMFLRAETPLDRIVAINVIKHIRELYN